MRGGRCGEKALSLWGGVPEREPEKKKMVERVLMAILFAEAEVRSTNRRNGGTAD